MNLAKELFATADAQFKQAAEATDKAKRSTYQAAKKSYAEAAKLSPGTPLEEDALMMIAESLFFTDEYVKAAEAYDQLVQRYQSTRHLDVIDQRRFAIARYWLELKKQQRGISLLPNVTDQQRPAMDTFGHAIKLLDKIRFDNPTGKLADDATMAAAIANFERERYAAADVLFDDVRENFPKSEHMFQAHLLGLKCKQIIYEGPDYDGGVLDQSEKIIQQIFLIFPDEAEEHRENLLAAGEKSD